MQWRHDQLTSKRPDPHLAMWQSGRVCDDHKCSYNPSRRWTRGERWQARPPSGGLKTSIQTPPRLFMKLPVDKAEKTLPSLLPDGLLRPMRSRFTSPARLVPLPAQEVLRRPNTYSGRRKHTTAQKVTTTFLQHFLTGTPRKNCLVRHGESARRARDEKYFSCICVISRSDF